MLVKDFILLVFRINFGNAKVTRIIIIKSDFNNVLLLSVLYLLVKGFNVFCINFANAKVIRYIIIKTDFNNVLLLSILYLLV